MLSDNSLPNMMIQSTTNNHLSIINNHCVLGPSTTVENSLQISSFMQNKANFPDDQMNVNKVLTKGYENIANSKLDENKPNTNPNKANLQNDQMNVSAIITKDYGNISNCALAENKPNSNPIQTQTKPISKAKKSCCRGNPHASHRAGAVTKFVTLSLTLLGIDANLLALQFKEDDLWNCPG